MKKNIYKSPEYQAYIERISAPPCPRRITDDELERLKKEKRKLDFDDNESADELNKSFINEFGDLSDEEVDRLYEKTFGNTAQE